MLIDCVELADCGSPEKLIAEITKQVPDMPIPVPIEELASAVGITAIHRMTTEGYEGGLITQPERRDGVILVNANGTQQRQRFTVGHELGHFLIRSHVPRRPEGFICSIGDMAVRRADRDNIAARMEAEANRFSAGILMPLARFKQDMRDAGSADLEHVVRLAERYDTSKEATALHYVLYSDERCAVLVSKDGRLKRFYTSAGFPYIDCNINCPLPATSVSVRRSSERMAWGEVDAGVWLSADIPDKRQSMLQEQTLKLANGWSMTLLIQELGDDEEADDGIPDAFDVWENPRFPGRSKRR